MFTSNRKTFSNYKSKKLISNFKPNVKRKAANRALRIGFAKLSKINKKRRSNEKGALFRGVSANTEKISL